MNAFTLTCTTCNAALRVKSRSALGQILPCPKCGSMVQVEPPAGWVDTPSHSPDSAGLAQEADATTPAPESPVSGPSDGSWTRTPVFMAAGAVTVVALAVLLALSLDEEQTPAPAPGMVAHAATADRIAPDQAVLETSAPEPSTGNSPTATSPTAPSEPRATTEENLPEVIPASGSGESVDAMELVPSPTPQAESPEQASSSPSILPTDPLGTDTDLHRLFEEELQAPMEPAAIEPNHEENKKPGSAKPEISVPPLERIPPPEVDVAARLADPLLAIQFENLALGRFIEMMSEMSTIPISYDAQTLDELGLTLTTPVSVNLSQTTIGSVLETVLARHRLGYVIREGQLLITHRQSGTGQLRRARYPIQDLVDLGDAEEKDEFASLVQGLIEPLSWSERGGLGRIAWSDDSMWVEHQDSAHYQIQALCSRLRVARGLRAFQGDRDMHSLASRWSRAKPLMEARVSGNFAAGAPLDEVAAHLAAMGNCQVVINGLALAQAELGTNTPARLSVEDEPLEQALQQLCEPLGLAFRVVSPKLIEISTPAALAEQHDVEFYLVGDLISENRTGDDLANQIRRQLATSRWSAGGGSGAIAYDAKGACLIVRQPQELQVQLEQLLAHWRANSRVARR